MKVFSLLALTISVLTCAALMSNLQPTTSDANAATTAASEPSDKVSETPPTRGAGAFGVEREQPDPPAAKIQENRSESTGPSQPAPVSELARKIESVKTSPSPGLADILKLAEAGVKPSVIQAYIENSGVAYNPSAREIVELQNRGVPDEVITALLQRGGERRAAQAQAAREAYKEMAERIAQQRNATVVAPTPQPAAPVPASQPATYNYFVNTPPSYAYTYPVYASYPAYSYSYATPLYSSFSYARSKPFYDPFRYSGYTLPWNRWYGGASVGFSSIRYSPSLVSRRTSFGHSHRVACRVR